MADDDGHTRFSDQALAQLQQEFIEHKEAENIWRHEQEVRWLNLASMVEKNTRATERMAEAVEKQAESTAGVVAVYSDIRGAARVGTSVRRFLVWLAGLGTAGTAIAVGVTWVLEKLGPPLH